MFNTENNSQEKLSGIVHRVTFHSEESGWSVLKVNPFSRPSDVITVTIFQAKVFAGASVDFYGQWTNHPKYGQQFKAEKISERRPATVSALEKYLGSGLIFGVGPKTAKKIVKTFKDQTLDVFENNIDRLQEVQGIAQLKLDQIKKSWIEHREIRNVMMFLQDYGVSTLYAVKIYKAYGDKAIEIVKNNPYRLSNDIYGIGFFSADKIALSLGIAKDGPERIGAAIKHILASSREEGHCFLFLEQIEEGVNLLLKEDYSFLIPKILEDMEKNHDLKVRRDERFCYYSKSLFYDEDYVAKSVKKRTGNQKDVDKVRVENWINLYNSQQKYPLSDEQRDSVVGIALKRFSILTGGPGCGKTTTTKAIFKLLKAMKKRILLAAPTGRAAQRMGEVIGMQAMTIHRLLVWDPSKGRFKKNEESLLETDFIIIDECSMLDINLTAALFKAIPYTAQILMIGDVDQLPSVGAGSVLRDFIDSSKVPCFQLTKIFRQAEEGLIVQYAHMVNKGITPKMMTPFESPELWPKKVDAQFIDSEEATQDDLKFLAKTKKILATSLEENSLTLVERDLFSQIQNKEESFTEQEVDPKVAQDVKEGKIEGYVFKIPQKYKHVNLENLLSQNTESDQLISVLKKVHPFSSLHYGLSATDLMLKLYKEIIPKYWGRQEIQILSPMSRGTLGTMAMNQKIQEGFNPRAVGKKELTLGERIFRVGDRVIQKRNNYDLNVFNGDIGKIVDLDNSEFEILVRFDSFGQKVDVLYKRENIIELDLAYAITIHKSQGSEFDVVILPIFFQHFKMLYRNLVYTGMTRAKKLVIFLGQRQAFSLAVKNIDNRIRQTKLKELILN